MTFCKIGVRRRALGLLAVAAALVGATVLSGCESGDSAASTPSATATTSSSSPSASSASPSPSPTPSSAIPAAAREKSDAGAEAFVRYFFDQVNDAWMAPDPVLIEQLSDNGCKSCAALADTAADLKKDGQRYREVPIDVVEISASAGAPKGQQNVDASLVQNEANVVDETGEVVLSDPEIEFSRTVALIWTGDGWLVFGLV